MRRAEFSKPEEYLTMKALTRILDISVMTVYSWRQQENGLPTEISLRGSKGNSVRFSPSKVGAWLAENKPDYLPKWEQYERGVVACDSGMPTYAEVA